MNTHWKGALAALAFAGALSGIVSHGASAQDRSVLRIVPQSDLKVLDPIASTQGVTQTHALMVYDFLFGLDDHQQPQPQMVGDYTVNADSTAYSFTLRDGLMFHDGSAVTTADVIASLKRWGALDTIGSQIFALTDTLAASDDKTFAWRFTKPVALLTQALAKTTARVPAIMPARLAAARPDEALTEVIGSGPFRFVAEEWVPGSRVVYARNQDYVPRQEPANGSAGGKVAKVDRVEWLNIADPQTAASALINGEIDFYETPPADFIALFQGQPITVAATNPIGFNGILRMNHLQPPFDRPEMRKAMVALVNQQTYLQAMFGNPDLYESCGSYFACGTYLATDAGAESLLADDPAKAARMFKDAGYDGSPITVMQPTDVATMNTAALVTAQLMRDAGLNVQLLPLDTASIGQRRANKGAPADGGWNILFTWWNGIDLSSPITNTPLQASCDKAWPGWPCDEELQGLIDAYLTVSTPEEQKALAETIQLRAFEVVPYINFGQWQQPVAYSNKLDGVLQVPGAVVFWNIAKT